MNRGNRNRINNSLLKYVGESIIVVSEGGQIKKNYSISLLIHRLKKVLYILNFNYYFMLNIKTAAKFSNGQITDKIITRKCDIY